MPARFERLWILCLCVCSSLAAADPDAGTLKGVWRPASGPAKEVPLSYHREREGAGRISVELPTGEVFVGEYLRLAGVWKPARAERIFLRWRVEGFDTFEDGPAGKPWQRRQASLETFQQKHRGRVVATLISPAGASMRCSFGLTDPKLGLSGGASGRCQITDGSWIDV